MLAFKGKVGRDAKWAILAEAKKNARRKNKVRFSLLKTELDVEVV
jgi:hypothetical protein